MTSHYAGQSQKFSYIWATLVADQRRQNWTFHTWLTATKTICVACIMSRKNLKSSTSKEISNFLWIRLLVRTLHKIMVLKTKNISLPLSTNKYPKSPRTLWYTNSQQPTTNRIITNHKPNLSYSVVLFIYTHKSKDPFMRQIKFHYIEIYDKIKLNLLARHALKGAYMREKRRNFAFKHMNNRKECKIYVVYEKIIAILCHFFPQL